MTKLSLGAAVLIVHDSKILCVRRGRSDKWGLPGGKLEAGEKTLDTAIRECLEETGIQLEASCGIFVYGGECSADHLSLKPFWVDAYLFKLPMAQSPRTMEKDNVVAWLTPEELMLCSSFPDYHQKLLSVVKNDLHLDFMHSVYGIAPD